MGLKKIARPLNKARNQYIAWLKKKKAKCINEYVGNSALWDYYRSISGFIDGRLYTVNFEMWKGNSRIDYRDESNSYDRLSIDEFLQLLD